MKQKLMGFTREEAVMAFTLAGIEAMIDAGLVEGPKVTTKKGKRFIDHLLSIGFQPTPKETEWAMSMIISQ